MTIASLDDYIVANKYNLIFYKTATRGMSGWNWFGQLFDQAGTPPAGTMSAGNTANGLVPDGSVTTGYITIPPLAGTGYISKVTYGNHQYPSNMGLYDKLFHCGAYTTDNDISLSSQPSFASRLPNGNYIGTELWVEQTASANTTMYCQVWYNDQDGNAGDTGAITITTPPIGRMTQLALAVGDTGISRINRVKYWNCTGSANFCILRPLWRGTIYDNNTPSQQYSLARIEYMTDDLMRTGMPKIFQTSALIGIFRSMRSDVDSMGLPYMNIEIADK